MYVDHPIQKHIVDQLRTDQKAFSELKPSGVENSLFMYHLHKLEGRHMVEKAGDTFRLTSHGLRWCHRADDNYRQQVGLRSLVQLFVLHNDMLLVSERVGPAAETMNRILLPGGIHKYGETSRQNAEKIATKFGVLLGPFLTHLETIASSQELHVLSDIYVATADSTSHTFTEPGYRTYFMPVSDVLAFNFNNAGALPNLIAHALDNTISPMHTCIGEID